MENEFGQHIRLVRCADPGLFCTRTKMVVDAGTQTETTVPEDVLSWRNYYIFLFGRKPTPKEEEMHVKGLYNIRIKRAEFLAQMNNSLIKGTMREKTLVMQEDEMIVENDRIPSFVSLTLS